MRKPAGALQIIGGKYVQRHLEIPKQLSLLYMFYSFFFISVKDNTSETLFSLITSTKLNLSTPKNMTTNVANTLAKN